jgi:AraC-like DNA-binding protein
MTVLDEILLFFSIQALLLSIFFWFNKKGNTYANKVFSIFLILFAYNVFFNMLYWSHFNEYLFATLSYTYFIPLSLYGPVFYFFIRNLITKEEIGIKDILHFIPFIVVMVKYGDYYFAATELKLELYQSKTIYKLIYGGFFGEIDYYLTLVLIFYSLFVYSKFKSYYKSDINLKAWLKVVSLFYFLFVLGIVSYYMLTYFKIFKVEYDYYNTISMVLFICTVSYLSVVHPEIINGKSITEAMVLPITNKYCKTGLSKAFSAELKEKLEQIMQEEKPYLNHELRLEHLAEMLDISRHHASQVINEHFSSNFFDFINKYRIKSAVKMMHSNKRNLGIADIAYECGFNNRVSFYNAFRKEIGTSPTIYRKSVVVR